jgi:serine/threonine protein kinase
MQNTKFPFPTSLEERYKSSGFISTGGAGAVYSALDSHLNKKVAIKLLSINSGDQKLLRFQQEAKVIGRFTHPNIVKALDFGIVDETVAYLVLELVGDASLNTLIQRKDQMSISKCLNIFRQICAGMKYAHEQGVLHRDLKPSNVLLENSASDNPTAKVADFGIAKIAGTLIFATTGNIYIGTPAFTSPEQFAGEDVDERSDVYSLGCLMYATLSGITPFVADNTTELAFKHINEPVPPLEMTYGGEEIPVFLQEIVGTCLEKAPEDRYEKFTEVAEALEQAQKEWSDLEFDKERPKIETISITPSSNPYRETSDIVPFKLNENRRSKQILATVLVFVFSLAAVICAKLFGFEQHSAPMNTSEHTTKITVVEKEVARELTLNEARRSVIPKTDTTSAKLPDSYLEKSVAELIKSANNEMGEQRYAAALAYLNRAIERQPQNSKALKVRSDCRKELDDYGGALIDIDAAIRLSPFAKR